MDAGVGATAAGEVGAGERNVGESGGRGLQQMRITGQVLQVSEGSSGRW